MAAVRNQANAERDRRICLLRRNGFTFSEIAQMEDLSRVRVSQIVAEHNAELGEDEGRAEIASILEFAEQKAVGLINAPGWKMRPDGRPAEGPDGEVAPDNGIVVEALKTLIIVADRKSRLYGWDKQQKRLSDDAAMQAYRASIEAIAAHKAAVEEQHRLELEAARRAGQQAIPGEVIARELPAAGG